ncbi:hypothetical protein [Halococcoides cellulosivorans]|uniref:Lipoprotein n=1 Tax=Halococcoides cellulosivorans TaxID=1679096 RepID=A0A2R4X313_9EURY|nr:hypothetical protein [Halococcoides cellulosivorans]AWB28184.1 hypothetical protein HARCEL1_10935 [Halococcoides cellulosivorans]
MHRRHVLALAALAVLAGLAGCSAEGSLSMDPVANESAIAERASVSLDAFDGADRALIAGAIDDEGPTATGERPPIEPDRPIAAADGYHTLSWSIVENTTRPRYDVRFEVGPNATSGRSIAYEDLPPVDREHVPIDELREMLDREDGPRAIGFSEVYTADERDESVLVADSEYETLLVDGRRVAIANDGTREVTVHTYRYDAERVAPSAAAFAGDLRSEYAFTLAGLTDAEREIVSESTTDTYYQTSDSEAWSRLVDRFRDERPVYADHDTHEYLVIYEGEQYWVTLYDVDLGRQDGDAVGVTPS